MRRAFMQACGLVNDHVEDCFRWQAIQDQYPDGHPRGVNGR